MGSKNDPGMFDCYANAEPDEPMFVLLGRDKHAPTLVWLWSVLRELDGENPAKIHEARECVVAMIAWLHKKDKKTVGLGESVLAGVLELIRGANFAAERKDNSMTNLDVVRRFLTQTKIETGEEKT